MNVQFDWQAGDERGRWETIATAERHFAFRLSRRVWSTLLLAVIVVAVGGALGVRYRYQVALRRLTSDIQAAIELEARALAQRDRDLFMAQQDEALPDWYAQQYVRFWTYRDPRESSRSASSPGSAPRLHQEDGAARPPPEVQKVRLRGDVAWVEVVEGSHPMRRARFYRQTQYGWKHTAPRYEFWQDPVERRYGTVTVRAQPYDLAHVEPLVEHLVRVVDEVSAALDDGENHRLEIDFVFQDLPDRVPDLKEGRLILASPWLAGIPLEGVWNPEYLDTLDYWAAYWAAGQYVQPAGGTSSSAGSLSAGSLSPLHRALVDEYAVLYSQGDVAQTPILHQIIEQHGLDVLPEMLTSLREPQDASTFLARWLLASPTSDDIYLHALTGIGWKAMIGGREDSCALVVQALDREDAEWVGRLETEWLDEG